MVLAVYTPECGLTLLQDGSGKSGGPRRGQDRRRVHLDHFRHTRAGPSSETFERSTNHHKPFLLYNMMARSINIQVNESKGRGRRGPAM